jgi:sugar/nucleoside kinase (ribokinase family)
MSGKRIICAGHVCIDITPAITDPGNVRIEEFLMPGKLIQVGKASVSAGGCVSNTGLGLKVLGADVSLMGKIGKDDFGELVLNEYRRYGAAEELIVQEHDATSYTVVIAIPGIDRIFLHHPGANEAFCAKDIPWEKVKGAALFHFGYPPIMKKTWENGGEELVKILSGARQANLATSLDLAAVDPNSGAGAQDWRAILVRALPLVDFFCPSIEELCWMLDRNLFDAWKEKAAGRDVTTILNVDRDIRPLAEECMALGCRVLLLKCGASGMYLRTADRRSLERISPAVELNSARWADQDFFEKSYVPEKVLSGTGAGDTSIAAFLKAVLDGYDPEMCMHLSAGTGASCVEAYDTLSGLRSFDQLKEKIQSGWKKNE